MSTRGQEQAARWSAMMASAQSGDRAAYTALLAELEPVIRALVRRWVGDAFAIDDVIQDVLVTVHSFRATYDPGRPLLPWLATIAHRRSQDHLRTRYRVAKSEVPNDGNYDCAVEPDAPSIIEAKEAALQLGTLLAHLPSRQREAIELVKLKELSLAEAAQISRQSVGAIKVSIHRAMKRLRLRSADDA